MLALLTVDRAASTPPPPPPPQGQKFEYLLNTGNLVSRSGLDLSQSTGFTVVAEKLNYFRWGGAPGGAAAAAASAPAAAVFRLLAGACLPGRGLRCQGALMQCRAAVAWGRRGECERHAWLLLCWL